MNVETWIQDFTYMPGWQFSVHEHIEGTLLAIDFTVPDSRNPGMMQDQRVWTFVPPAETKDEFFRWLHWRLTRIALHEVNEFFIVDGDLPYDPHHPIEEQLARRAKASG